MKPEAKEKLHASAPSISIGAIIVALATMVGGISECSSTQAKAQQSETLRVESDQAIFEELQGQLKEYSDGVGEELDELHEAKELCEDNQRELEIRIGVLERLGPDDGLVRDALLEELLQVAEEEGATLDSLPVAAHEEPVNVEKEAEVLVEQLSEEKSSKKKRKAPSLPALPASKGKFYEQIQKKAW